MLPLFMACLTTCLGALTPAQAPQPERVNELQFIGTHNSYHIAPDASVLELIRSSNYQESPQWGGAKLAEALDFNHPPIEAQLDMGLRVFEFDIHDDPQGGTYASPGFLSAVDDTSRSEPVDPAGHLARPGFKVFHAADTDVRSQCLRFADCLTTIRDWSRAHPGHAPIFIQIETKEGGKPALLDAYEPTRSPPFDDASWARLHAEIEEIFTADELFRPQDLRGDYDSVNAAARAGGWPAQSMQGRIVFLLLDDPDVQDAYVDFAGAGPKPILFVSRGQDDAQTAWLIKPKPDRQTIQSWVRLGFLVYTRADASGAEARAGDMSRAQEAFASGAQLIATDYPQPDPRYGDYQVSFTGRYVRCNVVMRPEGCD